MPLPLEGIRVIDWTIWQQGPVARAMLGDLGADVIKIEGSEGGDSGRGMFASRAPSSPPNFYFEANNRNKRSITLDLKQPEAWEVVDGSRRSDVFIQNFRRLAERLGLDYARCARATLGLSTRAQAASAAGPKAPPVLRPAGPSALGDHDRGRRARHAAARFGGGIADQMGAIMLAYGVLTALVARER